MAELTDREQLVDKWLDAIKTKPLPKNMNPAHHSGKREARARAFNRLLESEGGVVFIDASKNEGKTRVLGVSC